MRVKALVPVVAEDTGKHYREGETFELPTKRAEMAIAAGFVEETTEKMSLPQSQSERKEKHRKKAGDFSRLEAYGGA